PAQVEQVRQWYQPLLEARYDDAAVRSADLDMLAAVAGQFESRERFLTELTLDPPQASGDLSGDPLLDEDYLVLSTVHSAKGREWDAVYLINVADGNFPNEYATGDAAAIEEERRLLYVAVTRARDSLCLVEPLRYRTTQQPRLGGDYVHGARSRFLTPAVLACMDVTPLAGPADAAASRPGSTGPVIDVAARLPARWWPPAASVGTAALRRTPRAAAPAPRSPPPRAATSRACRSPGPAGRRANRRRCRGTARCPRSRRQPPTRARR